jgi:DNA end-binding protein Ku
MVSLPGSSVVKPGYLGRVARAIWSGTISFGLVSIPVRMTTATESKELRFHFLTKGDLQPVGYDKVRKDTGEHVDPDEIVRGFEIEKGRYVELTEEDIDRLDIELTHSIDICDFVDLEEIDPIYYDHSYYLAPATGGAKAYRLLLDAMREEGKVGIGRIVLRTKQQLCALRPTGDVLTLSTMLFGDEVVAPDKLDELDAVEEAEASERELRMAEQLIESLSADFEPDKFRDEYRERVLELIERKAAGEEIAVQPQVEEPSPAPDLMAALEASLAAVRAEDDKTAARDGKAPKRKPAPRKAKAGAKR